MENTMLGKYEVETTDRWNKIYYTSKGMYFNSGLFGKIWLHEFFASGQIFDECVINSSGDIIIKFKPYYVKIYYVGHYNRKAMQHFLG